MSLCGAHSARTIVKLVSQKASARSVPQGLRARGLSPNFLGARLTRRLALRVGLSGGDIPSMWRGLQQATRLRWLERELVGYTAKSYTHVHDGLDILATGDGQVFRRWLSAVPARLDSGHPYCVVICNGLTAWGRGSPGLRDGAVRGLSRTRHLSAPNRFEKAAMGVLLGGFLDDAALTRTSLEQALAAWRPLAWQDSWFYIHHLMALFNVSRTMLSEAVVLPEHDRFIDPPVFDRPKRGDLVDFSERAPTLHRWVAEMPEVLDDDEWSTSPLDDDEEDELLAAVHAAPADDGPRLVYADWLMAHGDPRGEFIALQMQAKLGREDKGRVERLGQVHARAWSAPLDGSQLATVTFERGFPAICRVSSGPMELDENPAWSTLVELHGAVPGERTPMPSLRGLGGLKTLETLAALEGSGRSLPIERLAYVGGGVERAEDLGAEVCPRLRELWILGRPDWVLGVEGEGGREYATPRSLAWIVDAPFTRGLRRVVLPLPCERLAVFAAAWLLDGARLEELVVSTQAGEAWDAGWQVRLARWKDGLEIHVAAAPSRKELRPSLFAALLAGLRALPGDRILRARCDGSVKKRPELEALRSVFPELKFSRLPRLEGFWETSR